MTTLFSHAKTWATTAVLLLSITAYAAPESIPADWQAVYDQGVTAYRDGNYDKAQKVFKLITEEVPKSVEGHYYLGISLAQMGRYKDAKEAYQKVIQMAPGSEAASLAQEGISYLPQPKGLDKPPVFQANPAPESAKTPESISPPLQPGATNPSGGLDQQSLQMMMMMNAMGGNGGGFNPMMLPLLQQMNPGQTGQGNANPQPMMSPELIKTMMMNQMMQDFSPFGSSKDND